MHDLHAKRKEIEMEKLTLETLRIHPEALAVLQARARRARAEAVHALVVRLIDALAPRLAVRRWIAHQG